MLTLGDQVEILNERCTCMACHRRVASWMAEQRREVPREGGRTWRQSMCGWCVLYSPSSAWGHANREELLHVGRAAQETALKSSRGEVPVLDDRGRLAPPEAEKFLLGVAFTDRMLKQLGGRTDGR